MSNWNGTAYHLTEDDVESALRTIISSDLVHTRTEYLARLALETEVEVSGSLSVNAGAGRLSDEAVKAQIPDDPEKAKLFIPKKYIVMVNQGMLDWLDGVAVVGATLERTGSVRKARSMFRWMRKAATCGCVGSDLLLRMWKKFHLENDSVQEEISRVYAKIMLTETLAHECGHVCLGHAPRPGQDAHMSISRNDERQADAFASSVIQSSCMGAQGAVCAALSQIGLMWAHRVPEDDLRFSSHPMNMERLHQYLEDFGAMLTVTHVKRNQLLELVP
jgi:hypothetical protein